MLARHKLAITKKGAVPQHSRGLTSFSSGSGHGNIITKLVVEVGFKFLFQCYREMIGKTICDW